VNFHEAQTAIETGTIFVEPSYFFQGGSYIYDPISSMARHVNAPLPWATMYADELMRLRKQLTAPDYPPIVYAGVYPPEKT